ncbi:MAG: hypothetical protein HYX75_14855 [Acidobacteria bacterium]|nr:hypothetical protein [Acidobacteriota bacterium]
MAEVVGRAVQALSRAISCASPYPPLLFALTDLAASGFETRADFMRQSKVYDTVIGQHLQSRYSEESAKNPSFGVNDFLDVSTRPRSRHVEPAFAQRLSAASPYQGLLVLWNALLVVAAISAFVRFDAR